jgi:5-methylthioadenosine/S-adenosylhomocysteine deaminase
LTASILFEDEMQIEIGDNEIGMLTLYIIEAIYRANSNVKICILCNYGIGISQFLKQKIERFIPNISVSILATSQDTEKIISNDCDFIVTTQNIGTSFKGKDVAPVLAALKSPQIQILRKRHYREYDTYYHFDDPGQGRLRYREDEFIDEAGRIENVRSRLTLIGERHEEIPGESESLLSRSRFLAPATHSLRFYAEYFKPSGLLEIQKDRLRYLVRFEDEEFFINLDTLIKPALGKFVEVKSRTWSRQDAVNKTELLHRLLEALGLGHLPIISDDYIHLVEESIQGV